ncbi:MAG: universal stress protein UspE [Bacteroidetes bacterium]|jgi:nucleotide-binding universal stress UspA family protein|nr:universal stress protein UspE [Bacteroidota bacterium]
MEKFGIKKILVPTDFSETAANALRQAIYLAKLNKADIKLLHVVNPVYTTGSELTLPYSQSFFNKIKRDVATHLKKIAADVKEAAGCKISCDVKMGNVGEVVNFISKKEKFDLVLMGTHGTSGVKEFFVGSNAYKVVHNASCPVITVQRKTKSGFKNIILPIRLGLHSRQKVDYVVELAKIYGATVHIVGFTDLKSSNKKDKLKNYVKQVEKYLKKLKIDFKSTTIFEDNFTKEILDYAKKNKGDLISVMNNNRLSLDNLLKGPFAKQFVNHSDIPVMSVPLKENDEMGFSPYLSGQMPGD